MAHRLAVRAVDIDPLSPRDANAQRHPKKTTEVKMKTAAQIKAQKNKEHPPPPPTEVREPPSTDRPAGALYQVGKLLGKGGFAICYDGQLLPDKKKYALKIVKSHMPPKMEQKFQTELQIHSKMKHKNIVQFFRAFSFNSCTFLVLEMCPNGSLMDMVKRRKGLTESEVRFYSVQITGAIKYMHGKGIIHRDLKMGNIFLDSQMNAKIGDFGLAALLVTGRDMQTIRRTTLCGTPNYIAPEILEKGRQGHDHMVDIWSLGIIVFAMLTSKPPFQSSTTDEIYRRAKERDYEWPNPETSQKHISAEAKDLVSTMLVEADRRPDPDVIIQHPFFKSGYMPSEVDMSSRLREVAPERYEFYITGRLPKEYQMDSYRNFLLMCEECCVGPDVNAIPKWTSVWKEMAAEEKAGLTPAIPLAEDIVYRPFEKWTREQLEARTKYAAPISLSQTSSSEDPLSSQRVPTGLLRQPPQSFAAQQRAQGRPVTISGPSRPVKPMGATGTLSASQSTRQRTRKELPNEAPRDVPQETLAKPAKERVTALPSRSTREAQEQLATYSKSDPFQLSDRVAAMTLVPSSHKRHNSESVRAASLFSPTERQESISGTKPDLILDRLKRLQAELERALNSRTMAIISTKSTAPPHPHIVVKWVDYTNKFGLGYILNDGSVGCILRDIPTTEASKTAVLPPAGVLIRGGERHILRRSDESYPDRIQPVPMAEDIKFFENNGERGLSEVKVSPESFRVAANEDGSVGKMNPGKDIHQHRKRERIILWKKFANYMIAYGRDEAVSVEENDVMSPGTKGTAAELVTFYQRFGDVGCWVYCDGHLQFNFPDHTKIVLDATGTWCHFWHLPLDAATNLAVSGRIDASALDDRAMLSYPLQTLLNFHTKPSTRSTSTTRRRPEIEPELAPIPQANDFRRKIEFIKDVVKEWVSNEGLGNSAMDRGGRLRWKGFRDTSSWGGKPQKQVWVTVGGRNGDTRVTCYVDPKKPWELLDEVETSRK